MLATRLGAQFPWLPIDQRNRMAQAYGTCAFELLGTATSISELGHHFGGGLFEIEVEYLCQHEFAQTAEDILWRRSKLGLQLSAEAQADLAQWLTERKARD
jgi:glycerol-3-phosphate dehydrogenase